MRWLLSHCVCYGGYTVFPFCGLVIPPASLWHTLKSTLPKTINASILALGLCATLFLSLLVATLPDSDEERLLIGDVNSKPIEQDKLPFWLKVVDVNADRNPVKTTRVAFSPTAQLHEQHAEIFTDEQDYQDQRAQGAKPCPNSDKSTPAKEPSTAEQDHCLMVQSWFPRNLILRETVLTDDAAIKPELEARLQTGKAQETETASASPSNHACESGKTRLTLNDLLEQVRGLNLQGRNFDYADFSASSLPKVDLRYASLKHANLSQTRLEQAHFEAAHLEQINLKNAILTDAYMRVATLIGAVMSEATLTGADMHEATLTGSNLSGADP